VIGFGGKRTTPSRSAARITSRVLASILALLGVMACGPEARAGPQTFVALEYDVAPEIGGCPTVDEFRGRVEHQLGYDPFRPDADRRVAIRIARKGGGLSGLIQWSDSRGHWVGERRLASRRPECGEIAATTVFAVAVQIQLIAALAPDTPPPNANETPAPLARSPPESEERPPRPSRPANRAARFRLSAGLGPSVGIAVAPRPAWLGRIFASGRVEWFSLELAVDGALPARRTEPDGSGFTLDRLAAAAAACGHVRMVAACLTGTFGRLEAHGFGVDKPASSSGPFSQIGARVGVTRELGGGFSVGARVDGLAMLSRWAVTLNGSVTWTTPPIGALIGFDLGFNFL
jgi:hypothetical protein